MAYRSKFEELVAKEIAKAKKRLKKPKYEPTTLDYTLHLEYNPDWEVTLKKDESKVYIEAKGKFNYIERRKALAVIASNPGIDLRFVFMRDNKISSKSKTRYTDWCRKHGIKCSVYPELPV